MHRCKISVKCTQQDCPVFERCSGISTEVMLDNKSNPEVDVLFIVTPGKNDQDSNVILSGKTGIIFRKLLSHLEEKELGKEVSKAFVPTSRVFSTNSGVIKCCRRNIIKDILRLKPKVIVPIGATASASLLKDSEPNLKETFLSEKSYFRDIEIKGKSFKVLPILSSSKVYENPNILCAIAEDLRRVLGIYKYDSMVAGKKKVIISSVKEAKDLVLHLKNLKGYEAVAVDTETKNLNRVYGNVLDSIQFCYDPKIAYFLWVSHPNSPFNGNEQQTIKSYLNKLFNSRCSFKYWVMHNAKYDLTILLSKLKARPINPVICTMMFSFILEENYITAKVIGGYALKHLAKKYGFKEYDKEALVARMAGDLRNLSPEKYTNYAINDVVSDIQLYYILKKMARGQKYLPQAMRLMVYFYNRVIRLLVEMEQNGLNLDFDKLLYLEGDSSPINIRMRAILEKVKTLESVQKVNTILSKDCSLATPLFDAPWFFNIDTVNHKQLLFFNVLGLKPLGITKVKDKDAKGNIIIAGKKVPAGALNKAFQTTYKSIPEVKILTEYNQLKKLKTSYIKSIKKFLDPQNGYEDYFTDRKIRPNFLLTAKTGRGRATNPNSQQIPRGDTPIKKAIKNLYCAPPGHAIVSLDYMAIEVRGWGVLANDLAMAEIFKKAKKYRDIWRATGDLDAKKMANLCGDIHVINASKMFNVPIEQVTKDMRQGSKPLTFGAIYAMSDKSLAIQMGCSVEEAKRRKIAVFSEFVEAGKWLDTIEQTGATQLYVEHPLGRRRRLWEFLIENSSWAAKAKRLARNCVDYKTEILTKGGWKKHNEIKVGDLVLTKNSETSNLEWKPINKIFDYPDYEGEIYDIKSRSFSAVCSPNHRWLIFNKTTKKNELRETSKLSVYGDHIIHRTGNYTNTNNSSTWTDAEVALIGWVVTDAYYRKSKIWNVSSIIIGQSKEENKPIIDNIFSKLFVKFSRRDDNRKLTEKTHTNWCFSGDLARKIRKTLPNRQLTPEFLLSLTSNQLNILCDMIVLGDGWIDRENNTKRVCCETEYEAEMLQILFTLMGKSASSKYYKPYKDICRVKNTNIVIRPKKGIWVVREYKRDKAQIVKSQIKKDYRKEPIWCINVENSTFVVKREGQVYITANSPVQGFASDLTFLGASLFLEYIIKEKKNWKYTNVVHDALYLNIPLDEVKECVLTAERFFTTDLFKVVERDFKYKIPFPLEAEFELGIYGGDLIKWDFSENNLDEIVMSLREIDSKRGVEKSKPYSLKL